MTTDGKNRMNKNIYVPEGFDARTHLPERLWKHADAAHYLLHTIEWNRVLYRRPRDEFNPLKAAYLNAMMGRWQAKEIRELLAEEGVIDIDPQYFPGEQSRGYKLGPEYRDATFRRHPAGAKLSERMEKNKLTKELTLAVHKHLYSWLTRLEVDHDAAMLSLTTRDEVIDKYIPLDMIADKQFYLLPDGYGRVHTNLSSLSRTLRPFLHCHGERLVMLDVKNSQPFFLSVLLLDLLSEEKGINSFYRHNKTHKENGEGEEGRNGAITIDKLLPRWKKAMAKLDLPPDVRAYISLTENGTLYEELGKVFRITDREEVKKAFFQRVLFCKTHKHPFSTAYSERFPTVARVITELKAKDHRRLSHYLQRCESAAVIHGVCERLRLDHPDVPVWTIHDSVMTTKPHVEVVRSVVHDQFAAMSLSPSISEQDYTLAA